MFTRIGPNSAQSSEGFQVERTGRMELKYSEKGHTLIVEVESGEGLAIYRSSIVNWTQTNDEDAIKNEDKERIIKNICAALDFLKIQYVLA